MRDKKETCGLELVGDPAPTRTVSVPAKEILLANETSSPLDSVVFHRVEFGLLCVTQE